MPNSRAFCIQSTGGCSKALALPFLLALAESGVKTPEDLEMIRKIGAEAALVGEAFMNAPDRKAFLREMKGRCR